MGTNMKKDSHFTVYFVDGGKEGLSGKNVLSALTQSGNLNRPFSMWFNGADDRFSYSTKRNAWELKERTPK